jgi:hypothetical protein
MIDRSSRRRRRPSQTPTRTEWRIIEVRVAVICACGGSSQTPQQRYIAEMRDRHYDTDIDTGRQLSDEQILESGAIIYKGSAAAQKIGTDPKAMIAEQSCVERVSVNRTRPRVVQGSMGDQVIAARHRVAPDFCTAMWRSRPLLVERAATAHARASLPPRI